jgi:hypothetical protein
MKAVIARYSNDILFVGMERAEELQFSLVVGIEPRRRTLLKYFLFCMRGWRRIIERSPKMVVRQTALSQSPHGVTQSADNIKWPPSRKRKRQAELSWAELNIKPNEQLR